MNAPLPAPALRRPRPNIAVIGAGPGGLAAAMQLAAAGARVTLFEKDEVVGGRSRTLTSPEGYRFDLGPTFFLYPRILREIFTACGADLDDEIELIQLDPQYRLIFEGKPTVTLDATGNLDRMEAAIAAIAPQDAAGVRRFMADNRWKLDAFKPVLEQPFSTAARMLGRDVLGSLPQLRPHLQVDDDLKRYFSDPRIRLAFSFQTKYLGMSPFKCPSMFTILSFLEYEYGVYHPRGGCGAVSDAMARVAERLGVEIKLNTPVDRITFQAVAPRAWTPAASTCRPMPWSSTATSRTPCRAWCPTTSARRGRTARSSARATPAPPSCCISAWRARCPSCSTTMCC